MRIPRAVWSSRRMATRVAATTTIAALLAISFAASPAAAATGDALNVAFNGSFVGTTSYTATGGEIMHGGLHVVTGDEKQVAGGGVSLGGGKQGIQFTPSGLDLGLATMTQGFTAEIAFTPTASPTDFATVFSVDGNFTVRASGGKLQYGFDSLTGSTWTPHRASSAYPTIGVPHVLSLQYLPGASTTELHISLDGSELPVVTSSAPAAVNASAVNTFGFGNDVHPAGLSRGFVGTVAKARVATATGAYSPAGYEFQPKPASTSLLDVGYAGTLSGGAYTATGSETLAGTLKARTGGESIASGAATLAGGKQAIDFTAAASPFGATALDHGFVAEAAFTPTESQADLGTLLAVGGNFFVRYQNNMLRYGYSTNGGGAWKDYYAQAAVPSAGTQHVISVAYVPSDDATTVIAWLDGKELTAVTGAQPSTSNPAVKATLSIGNEFAEQAGTRGFVGTIQKTRFALLNGDFTPGAFTYQSLATQDCTPLSLDPANYVTVTPADCDANILAKSTLVRPTSAQLDWQELRLTAFVHFGINTFYNQEWGDGTEDPAKFAPTGDLDPASWVKSLRDAGFRQAILVIKHHDGFVLYPTRYTDFSVKSSPWENGHGDVLKGFTDAARKYGMKVGVYLSPADSHEENLGVYGNGSAATERTIPTLVAGDDRAGKDIPTFQYKATDYGAYFLNLLYEVLTQYGPINEVWFDGAEGNTTKTEIFDYPAFYDLIHKLQPNALTAVGGRDIRWVGNEQGVARDNEWGPLPISDPADGGLISAINPDADSALGSDSSLIPAVTSGQANALHWWPAEADMKLTSGWFAHPGDQPASAASLLNSYQVSTGHNGMMLLNVPPTKTGSFAPASVSAIDDFASLRREAYTKDILLGVPATIGDTSSAAITDGNSRTSWASTSADPTTVEFDLPSVQTVNTVTLSEDTAAHGQSISQFSVQAKVGGTWTTIALGGTIGVYRVLPLATAVTAQQFRVSIEKARGPYSLANVSLYQTLAADPGRATEVYLDCSAVTAGDGGSTDHPLNSLEQFRQLELAPGAAVHIKSGTTCPDSDTPFWGYGTADQPITVTTYGGDAMPQAGDRPMSAVFAPLTAQGWKIDLATAPTPTPTPTVALDASSVEAGSVVHVTIDGFAANTPVEVSLLPDPVGLGTVTTDAAGHAALAVTIPASTTAGPHQIVAAQADTTAEAALTVTTAGTQGGSDEGAGGHSGQGSAIGSNPHPGSAGASAASDALASTGSSITGGVGIGVLALMLGAAALVGVRRRRRRSTSR